MTDSTDTLRLNYSSINERILRACTAAGRRREDVELIAASKYQSTEKIKDLFDLGLKSFGENYQQELSDKRRELDSLAIRWVFIGALQSNKIAKIVADAAEIQTVASLKHARYIARYAEELNKTPYPVYISVNAGHEATKAGVDQGEELEQLASAINDIPSLLLKGIMTIPPAEISKRASLEELPPLYKDIAALAKNIGQGYLSMGMSSDLEAAIAAGANCVRIGTALMGPRPAKP